MDTKTKEIILGQAINNTESKFSLTGDCATRRKKEFMDRVKIRFETYLELHTELIR